ncbi:MAG: glycoside hydrolase family 3 C-terminal domain-containing protein [Bacteroides sp.]|nr:glycoside hydrolase family 3 C-terminal domain-containing protein [Bacteroides sp.]
MKTKKIWAVLIGAACSLELSAQGGWNASTDGAQEMDAFITSLMGRMTVAEKIGQLNLPVTGDIVTGEVRSSDIGSKIQRGQVGGLFGLRGVEKVRELQQLAVEKSRLGIPLLFGMDVIHGYETIFPIPLGLSCTWDMASIEESARIAAVEATADGLSWTFSPMVDITRDPRWGRVSEGSGEDSYLGSLIAQAMIRGYQGAENPLQKENEMMACVKHFALYGAAEGGRDYNTVDMSRQTMYNVYFPPFLAAVQAGVGSVMAAFNEVDGVPATANRWLMTDVLRKQWGFDGFVVSDYTGVDEMVEHGLGSRPDVAALALEAGVDMDMVSEAFTGTLLRSLQQGKVSMSAIDAACRRILEAKYRLGLFQNPYKYCNPHRAKRDIYTTAHRKAARRIAAESFVLLKNEAPSPDVKDGNGAACRLLPLTDYLAVAAPGSVRMTTTEAGGPFDGSATIGVIGPLANTSNNMNGTWAVTAVPGRTATLLQGLTDMVERLNALPVNQPDEPWYIPLMEMQTNLKLLYAKGSNLVSDSLYEARATMFGRELGRDGRTDEELLQEALAVARQSDVIVAALGESSEMSGESSSRTELDLPDVQRALLQALLETGKPVVLVLFTGRPLTLTWEQAHVPAILNVWFGGSEAADAIADVLFGRYNPGGKLTMTWPKTVGQIPLYYAHKNTGRPLPQGEWFRKFRSNYLDVDNEPLYPFGYGLSYTTFGFGPLALNDTLLTDGGALTASLTVTNTGRYPGSEVVQLYLRDLVGSTTRPVKELKGFQKIWLNPGESRTVSFTITPDLLKFYDADLHYVAEPGDFLVMVGSSSRDVQPLKATYAPQPLPSAVSSSLTASPLSAATSAAAAPLPAADSMLSDEALMDSVERRTFLYFWQGAEPHSGLAPERIHMDGIYPQNDAGVVTSGGSGFGIMALIAGVERGWITPREGFQRFERIVSFLEQAERFHGASPHWWVGSTGRAKAFSPHDDGADLVETAFLMQGLLCLQQYYAGGSAEERALAVRVDSLWRGVEWDFFRRDGRDVLYWHWSPVHGWAMDFPVRGYNECLVMYLLAAASPTHGVPATVYHQGWAGNGAIVRPHTVEGIPLRLHYQGGEAGPLFWAQYSFLGLDPRGLADEYCPSYFHEMRNLTLVNRAYCIRNPHGWKGFGTDCWGLTASYSVEGYAAHAPAEAEDRGVIAPTAALSSIVYTPEASMQVMRHLYGLGNKLWGPYGFYDAFSPAADWYPRRYLAIDQGPVVVMIENYRTGLLWRLFMSHPDVQRGLALLGFTTS